MRNRIAMTLLLLSGSAMAETAYVSDRLSAPLRWAQGEAAPIVKQLESGTPVDVLERASGFVRVKDKQGTEGWLDARQLSADAPARAQLARANDEIKQLRSQLANADAELKKARAVLAEESAKIKTLEARAAAHVPAATASAPTTSVAVPSGGSASSSPGGGAWAWLLGGFAMLGVGFVAGILWLRESIKRRSGGMYIKV